MWFFVKGLQVYLFEYSTNYNTEFHIAKNCTESKM